MDLETSLREQYLDTLRRFENGDENVRLRDVIRAVFKYYILRPKEYLRTFVERVKH